MYKEIGCTEFLTDKGLEKVCDAIKNTLDKNFCVNINPYNVFLVNVRLSKLDTRLSGIFTDTYVNGMDANQLHSKYGDSYNIATKLMVSEYLKDLKLILEDDNTYEDLIIEYLPITTWAVVSCHECDIWTIKDLEILMDAGELQLDTWQIQCHVDERYNLLKGSRIFNELSKLDRGRENK